MQLLIILALLLYGGNKGGQNILENVKPVLESFGGDEIKEALKSAEEITSALSAVRAFAGGGDIFGGNGGADENFNKHSQSVHSNGNIAFPLSPICNIADKDITYSLSKYIE